MKDRDDTASAAGDRPPEALTLGQRHGWVIAAGHLRLGDPGRPAALRALADAGYPPAEAERIVEAILLAWPPSPS